MSRASCVRPLVLVAACLTALIAGPPAAHAARPAGSTAGTAVSPTNAVGEAQQRLLPLAGNGSYLVYLQWQRRDTTGCLLRPSLHVLDADGHVRLLASQGVLDEFVPCGARDYSLAGDTLSTPDIQQNGTRVYWWDLSGSAHGSRALPSGRYLGSAPGGWLFARGDSIERESTGGTVTELGTFAAFDGVAVGTHGLVLHDGGKPLRYLRYGRAKPVVIGRPGPQYPGGGSCFAVSAAFAACGSEADDSEGDPVKVQLTIVPLDGATSRTCTTCLPDYLFADELDHVLAVTPQGVTGVLADGSLRTVHPDGQVSTGPAAAVRGTATAVSAFGDVVVEHVPGTLTQQSGATSDQRVLMREKRVVSRASDFAITTGRIVWKSDEDADLPGHSSRVFSRDVSAAGLAASRTLVNGGGEPLGLAASGTYTADRFLGTHQQTPGYVVNGFDLGSRTFLQQSGLADPVLQTSGTRTMWFKSAGAGLVQPMVTPLDGPATSVGPVQRARHGSHWLQPAAIWGDNVYYAEPHGGIARRDLADGTTSTVLAPDASLPVHPAMEIFAYGDEVGWDIGASRVAYRDVTSSAAPISVASGTNRGRVITGLSVDGVTVNAQGLLPYRNLSGIATVFRLVPYGATGGSAVLSGSHLMRGPQLSDGVQAWLDDSGVVRESALPGSAVVAAAPRHLGADHLPSRGDFPGFRILVPYSEALTSCTIVLSQAGSTLATLPCDSTQMSLGDAAARWNGEDASGSVVHGSVSYTVHAAGVAGPALLSDGTVGEVAGSFTV